MKQFLVISLLSLLLFSCVSRKTLDIKSPCVSNDEGPCGPRKSVNDWWIKNNNIKS